MLRLGDRSAVWAWEQPEAQQQILLLRRARNAEAFPRLHIVHRCQILTNLANQLDTVGRFIEARAMWSEALALMPDFWMARGNRGNGLLHYAGSLYDHGRKAVFALHAHRDLIGAMAGIEQRPDLGDPRLLLHFAASAAGVGRHLDVDAVEAEYQPDGHDMGVDQRERAYRAWALSRVLFLNPLNDVAAKSIAAQDVLMLPSFTTGIEESPVLIGFFNQLKQEFASARWLLYCGTEQQEPHPSDRGVLLYNTLDYPAYGLGVEQVKVAFRMAYSLFDKVAFFLNRYLQIGVPEKRVSFRSIWREKESGPVRPQFNNSENWPLRGLYWLSKDLFEQEMREVTEPDARALNELRNHLEHKYVKVHELSVPQPPEAKLKDSFFDDYAYALRRDQLERMTLKLLRLARSAIIYLSLGMHREEQQRQAQTPSKKFAMPMVLDTWSDDWKR